ncbi:MAG: 3-phosphoshikimate 1-carboxyvinyltransferase, partial [Patescibacteria group bacterium]
MKTTKIIPLEKPIDAVVSIPGSKSYTNRALLMAALVGKTVIIRNPLLSDDTKAMIDCLKTLGISVAAKGDYLEVAGDIRSVADKSYELNAHLSGTTIRFILALSAVIAGVKTIRGEGRLNERPIGDLVDALRQLGAKIEYLEKEGFPPVRVSSSKLVAGNITMNGSVSSQFLSAILVIAPIIGEVNIEVIGEQISKPYIDMTIDSMKQFGARVEVRDASTYAVPAGQKYNLEEYVVEGDASSASYFFAIAALTQSRITLKNMNPKSVQADMGFLKILADMGNVVEYGRDEVTIQGKGIKAVDVNMQDCPDQVQTLAALSACVSGTTHIAGVGSLRVKETERVAALERELAKMGIRSESTPDTMTINGGYPKPAVIDTYWDHRMAISAHPDRSNKTL